MRSVKELRQLRAERADKKARMYSTSEGRANFAEALELAQIEHAVIGFDRYGRPLAALVPIDAVRMLAGASADVDPAMREKVARMARLFLANIPSPNGVVRAPKKAPRKRAKTSKKKRALKSR